MVALLGGIAIGFVLGAFIAPRIRRSIDERLGVSGTYEAPGSTSFTGPIGAEGGGYDGEPLE
ncbi:MAG: hypothetical protein JOZ59_07205 [Candidatus Eremiobacteraeota bacterium]|nr:hypothetical protein [Candidatus Eremiobacteraeota bacterium]